LAFGYLIENAGVIITDSGNIAEEATFLNVPCITLNDYAEHPETYKFGTNELVGEDTELLGEYIEKAIKGDWKKGSLPEQWDGRTAERIVQILLSMQQ
jgi:UDP-N-acetylglucosamine 2-epimerase (non-hydrolysing)